MEALSVASGLPDTDAFDLTIGQYAIAGVATALSMGALERVGRRTLWLWGLAGMLLPVACIGVLSLLPRQAAAVVWPQGVFVLVRFFAYGVSCGPIPFVYCGEIGSVRLRQKVKSTLPSSGLSYVSMHPADGGTITKITDTQTSPCRLWLSRAMPSTWPT